MVREMLLSEKAKKAVKMRYCAILVFMGLFFLLLVIFNIFFLNRKNIQYIIFVFSTIYSILFAALLLNYARTPARLEKIDGVGFEYITVLGKRRRIRWEQIVEIQKFREYPDMGILYRTKTGKEGIEIRADVGEEIRRAWERWKEEQEVKR